MRKYIEMNALIEFANNHKEGKIDSNDISRFPISDVAEVRHGKWNINCDGYYPYCSECGYEPEKPCFHKDNRTPYCPNCGAKMHLEVESTTYCTDKKNHLCHCEDCHERECE